MTNITVLEKENLGQETKVTVQIESSVILSVNRELISTDYSPGDYHDSLHTERIDHDHNSRVYKLTLWMDNPYTSEKLNNLLVDQIADIESVSHLDYLNPIHDVQETCTVNGISRNHYHISKCPQSVTDALIASFPNYDLTKIAMISAPVYHEILEQTVISVFLKEHYVATPLDGDTPLISICRKYCLESGEYYDRYYGFVSNDETFSFIPDSCTLMAKSYNSNVQGELVVPDFYDVYFSGEPSIVEKAFNLPHNIGSNRTYYGVTVQNNTVMRAKQYCYNERTLFSDWTEAVIRAKTAHNLI
jgi:hypothetical protein|tara:strand:- start:1 stop:909 length:909 start_codon:yes stop_codon:yes gene_type:complete